jgi:hypothetical protein
MPSEFTVRTFLHSDLRICLKFNRKLAIPDERTSQGSPQSLEIAPDQFPETEDAARIPSSDKLD